MAETVVGDVRAPVHAVDADEHRRHYDQPRRQGQAAQDQERGVPLDLYGKAGLDQGQQGHHGYGEKEEEAAVDQVCPGQQGPADGRPALLGGQERHHGDDQRRPDGLAPCRLDGPPEIPGVQQVTHPDDRQPQRQPGDRHDAGPDRGARPGRRPGDLPQGCWTSSVRHPAGGEGRGRDGRPASVVLQGRTSGWRG